MRAPRTTTTCRAATAALVPLFVIACGGEPADSPDAPGEEGTPAAAPGAAADAPAPSEAPATTAGTETREDAGMGTFSLELAGARDGAMAGEATFSAGGRGMGLQLTDDGGARTLRVEGHRVFEAEPVAGSWEIEPRGRTEPGWSATLVDRDADPAAGGGMYGARAGTLTITSAAPDRLDGSLELVTVTPRGGDTVRVQGTFEAVCETVTGPGACW